MAEITECILKRIGPGCESDISTYIVNNTYTCGRSQENNLVCSTNSISKRHCIFFRKENDVFIQDLKSTNGTFVNGKRIVNLIMHLLKDGDIVGVGTNEINPNDLNKFVYRLHKQVIIDSERKCLKTEKYSENENYYPPNKLSRLSEFETFSNTGQQTVGLKSQLNNKQLTLRHKTPITRRISEMISTNSVSTRMSIEISVNNLHEGTMPNIFLNHIPISYSSDQEQPERIPFQTNISLTDANNSNRTISQDEDVIIISDDNNIQTTKSALGPLQGNNIIVENSKFSITGISHRNLLTQINPNVDTSSSLRKKVSVTEAVVEKLKETEKNDGTLSVNDTSMILRKSKSRKSSRSRITNKTQESDLSYSKSSRKTSKENSGSTVGKKKKRENLEFKSKGKISNKVKKSEGKYSNTSRVLEERKGNLKIEVPKTKSKKNSRKASKSSRENSGLSIQQSCESKILNEKKKKLKFEDTKISEDKNNYLNKNSNTGSPTITSSLKRDDLELEKDDRLVEYSDSDESFKLHMSDDEINENSRVYESNNIINSENLCEFSDIIENAIITKENQVLTKENTTFIDDSVKIIPTYETEYPMNLENNESETLQISSYDEMPCDLNPNCENILNSVNEISHSNDQYLYPVYPNSYENNQIFHQNCQYPLPIYPVSYQNSQNIFPYVQYPVSNYIFPIPSIVPPPPINVRDPRSNKQRGRYLDDISLSGLLNSQETSEDKMKIINNENIQLIGKVDSGYKKSVPRVISSEIVNLPYKFSFTNKPKPEIQMMKKVEPPVIQKPPMSLQSSDITSSKSQISDDDNLKNDAIVKKDNNVFIPETTSKLGSIHTFCPEPQPDVKRLSQLKTYIPKDELYRSSAKSDEVLMNIVSWRPAEFESCFFKDLPHVLDEEKLEKTRTIYDSHDDYCKVLMPLLLVKVSYKIKNSYNDTQNKGTFTNCEVVKNSASIIWIENSNSYMMGFQIKIRESKLNMLKQPVKGDFLRIEIIVGETNFRTLMFAYVAKVLDSQSEQSEIDSVSLSMTFQVVTKLLEFNLYESKIKKMSVKMSLLPFINLVMALDKIKDSPLLPMILHPGSEDYALGNHLNPDYNKLLQTSSIPELLKKEDLNYIQLSAIRKIADEATRGEVKVALIEGAPGTGKTKVITNIIIETLNNQTNIQEDNPMKILVCAETDSQIDEILHRIYDMRKHLPNSKSLKMVRVGLLEKMSKRAKDFSLQELAKRHIKTNLSECCTNDLSTPCEHQLNSLHDQMRAMREEIKQNQNQNAILRLAILNVYLEIKQSGRLLDDIFPEEYAQLMQLTEQTILSGANLIICTLDTCYSNRMEHAFSDGNLISVLIVEDATQTLEFDLFKPLTFGVKTLILAGDSCKRSTRYIDLGILNSHGFNESLFSRLKAILNDAYESPVIKLKIQYRMNRKIAFFPNKYFHGGKIKNDVESGKNFPLISYRIFNLDIDNSERKEIYFVSNLIMCVVLYAELKNTPKPLRIGIITASNNTKLQIIKAIEEQFKHVSEYKKNSVSIEVDVISKFMNQERDIIVAFCRKPKNGQRLIDLQRMYSLITLAKHSLILYGTFNKFRDEKISMWNALVTDAIERNMLINIDSRDLHHSKLKNLVLRC